MKAHYIQVKLDLKLTQCKKAKDNGCWVLMTGGRAVPVSFTGFGSVTFG